MSFGQNPFGDQYGQSGQGGFQGPQGYGNYNQPSGKYYPPGSVKNYLIESILSLVFCGGILAIPAIIYASQVDSKLQQGDYHGAVEASNNAKMWLTIAVSFGVICGFGGFCLVFLSALAGAH